MKDQKTLLEVSDLSLSSNERLLLNGISFGVKTQEIVAIVGESGSGKSLTALSVAGLLFNAPLSQSCKKMQLGKSNLLSLTKKEWQALRGKHLGMIFQEPQSSLNPSMRCGPQVLERLRNNQLGDKKSYRAQVLSAFEQVQLPQTERIFKDYPHEHSGGQKQRVMIAMALIGKPDLLLADETTTALDVAKRANSITIRRPF